MSLTPWPAWLVLAALAGTAAAQDVDPLHTPACRQALDALQAEEAAAHGSGAGPGPSPDAAGSKARILAKRKFAAGTCLGAWMDAPPQAHRGLQAPIRVTPVASPVVHPPPVVAGTPPAASPVQAAPKPSIVSCDVGGCTTSDGARLPRVGGILLGPNGPCAAQTAGQVCP
jgi:hypothetical protein